MKITVLYFAQLKVQRGLSQEAIETDITNVEDLYSSLASQHGLQLSFSNIRTARNEVFCNTDEVISDGDTIAFMPPMAGG